MILDLHDKATRPTSQADVHTLHSNYGINTQGSLPASNVNVKGFIDLNGVVNKRRIPRRLNILIRIIVI